MPARENIRAGGGTRRAVPELFHFRMRTAVEMPAERRGEIRSVTGGIGDDVVAPVIEHPPVRVGEAIGYVAVETCSAWLVAIYRAVLVADRTVERLHVG